MKRVRKKAMPAPDLAGPVPDDLAFLQECKFYLEMDSTPDPYFVRELLERYIAINRGRRLRGPEIAAMVDWKAVRSHSFTEAIKWVQGLTGDEFTLEAIERHHTRYGKRDSQIKVKRDKRMADLEEESKLLKSVSDEVWLETKVEIEEYQKKMLEYLRLQAELYPPRPKKQEDSDTN